jgi:hypothetical protein
MFEVSNDWSLAVSTSSNALLDEKERIITPIPAIEPDHVFFSPIVGVYVDSITAPQQWYRGGDLYQALLVPFGEGYAQGELSKIVLRRYTILCLDNFPTTNRGDTKYLLSYSPPTYFKDVILRVWEFKGSNPANLEGINTKLSGIIATQDTITGRLNEIIRDQS